jgi:hypothetical protein
MKSFLNRVLVFILPVALLLIGLELSIRRIPNSHKLKTAYLNENAAQIETLILGSSHTFYGLNPRWFRSNTFNAAHISQSPAIDYAILEHYESQLTQLNHIIIRLSYDTLFEQLKDSPEDWRLKDYRLYTELDLEYDLKHYSELMSAQLQQSLKTFKNYYLAQKPAVNCDSLGFGRDIAHKMPSNLETQGPVTANKHTAISWQLLPFNIETFKTICSWAEKNKVQLYIISPPAYKTYVRNLDNRQYTQMVEVGQALDKASEYCHYVNLMEHSNFGKEDFFDPDHLNSRGARKFSILLDSIIKN